MPGGAIRRAVFQFAARAAGPRPLLLNHPRLVARFSQIEWALGLLLPPLWGRPGWGVART